MSFEAGIAIKITIILAAAGLLSLLLRNASAAARHAVWTVALWAALALPAALAVLPKVELAVLPVETATTDPAAVERPAPGAFPPPVRPNVESFGPAPVEYGEIASGSPPNTLQFAPYAWSWREVLSLVWGLGALVIAVRAGVGFWRVRRLRRNSRPLAAADWQELLGRVREEIGVAKPVELRIGGEAVPPMTWGVFRPVILMPAAAAGWSAERRRLVLAHELAHVQRRDSLTQIVAQAACSLYWFHPLVWYAAHRMRIERECACDDRVLNLGAAAADYADHLLQIARGINSGLSFATVSMAQRSQLETRLAAILEAGKHRHALSRLATAALTVSGAVLMASVAAIQLTTLAPLMLSAEALNLQSAPFPPPPIQAGNANSQNANAEAEEGFQTEIAEEVQTSNSVHIAGIVRDAQTGMPLADVELSGPTVDEQTVRTGQDGRFELDLLLLPPCGPEGGLCRMGVQLLQTSKTGYSRGQVEGRTAAGNNGVPIVAEAGDRIDDLTIWMAPLAGVTGRVFDAQGRPLQGAQVIPFRYAYNRAGELSRAPYGLSTTGQTNDLGEFRIDGTRGLGPGEYYFEIRPPQTALFTPDPGGPFLADVYYYPGVLEPENARTVRIESGSTVDLGVVSLFPSPAARLYIRVLNETGGEFAGLNVRVVPAGYTTPFRMDLPSGIGAPSRSGRMLWAEVGEPVDAGRFAPGVYDVMADVPAAPAATGITRVEIGGGDLQVDVTLRPAAPSQAGGQALVEDAGGSRPVGGVTIGLLDFAAPAPLDRSALNPVPTYLFSRADGVMEARNLGVQPPRKYRVSVVDTPAGFYVDSVTVDGRDVLREGISRGSGAEPMLNVILRPSAGSIAGVATDANGQPVLGATVALVPDDPSEAHRIMARTSDARGAFRIDATPGAYRLYAWRELIGAPYYDPEFMRRYDGQGVPVRADAPVSINLRVLEN